MLRISVVFEVVTEDEVAVVLKKLPHKIQAQLERPPALCEHLEADDQLRGQVGQVVGRVVVSRIPTDADKARVLIEAFRDAAVDLDEAWPTDSPYNPTAEAFSEGYPFQEDFETIVARACAWASAHPCVWAPAQESK